MEAGSILLRDLVGGSIDNIGTIRCDEDGDDMIYFYLDSGLVWAADRPNLWALTYSEFDDVFVDFTDFLEQDSPRDEEDWHERSGTFLLLADLMGHTINAVSTGMVDGARWVFFTLTDDFCLAVPFGQLVADGEYSEVWTDSEAVQEEEGTDHGAFAYTNAR